MKYDTPILTKIETAMCSAIAGIRKVDGYYLDWATVNEPDVVKQDFPSAEIILESEICLDEQSTAWNMAYNQEATFNIRVRVTLENEEEVPLYEINKRLNLALDDLKRLFGINYTLTDSCETIMYNGAQRIVGLENDIFRPAYLETKWIVRYTQVRTDPSRYI